MGFKHFQLHNQSKVSFLPHFHLSSSFLFGEKVLLWSSRQLRAHCIAQVVLKLMANLLLQPLLFSHFPSII